MKKLNFLSRDNGRTPMQWDTSINAGFTTGTPWLPVNENHKTINVVAQEKNPNSVLNHFKKMVNLRKNNDVLIYGDYSILNAEHPEIYAYTRELDGKRMLVLLNFENKDSSIELLETNEIADILINNFETVDIKKNKVFLKPYQAVLFSLK